MSPERGKFVALSAVSEDVLFLLDDSGRVFKWSEDYEVGSDDCLSMKYLGFSLKEVKVDGVS